MSEIEDTYKAVKEDVADVVSTAQVVAVRNTDGRGLVLFPRKGRCEGAGFCLCVMRPKLTSSVPFRHPSMFSVLSGTVSVNRGSKEVHTTADLRKEIHRGDCIIINGASNRLGGTNTAVATI